MEQYIRITESARNVRRMALAELRGHWKTACLAFVLYYALITLPALLLNYIFGGVGVGDTIFDSLTDADFSALAERRTGDLIEPIYSFIIYGPLTLGLSGFILSLSRGASPGPGAVLDGFNNFLRAFGTYALIMLRLALFCLPFVMALGFLFVAMIPASRIGFRNTAAAMMPAALLFFMIVAIIAMIVISVWVTLSYSQAFFLLVDDPRRGVGATLKQSRNMMFGNKKKLLFLYLSFIGWGLAWFIIMSLVVYFLSSLLIFAPFFVRLFATPVVLSVFLAPLYVYVMVSGAVFYDILTGRRGSWPAGGESFGNVDSESFRNFNTEASRIASGEDREPYGNYDADREPYGNTGEDREPYRKDGEDR